jgi:cation diffusion facilitator family transporter
MSRETGKEGSENMSDDLRSEKRKLNISFAGSLGFLAAEILMAFVTHSRAVLADCVYDLADMAMLGPFMILVPLLYKPATEKHPYGYSQVESLFIIIKSGILMFIDIQLIISSVRLILHGGHDINAGTVAIFEISVSVTCVIMWLVLRHLRGGFDSPTIKAELYIWKLDAVSTLGVGAAFIVQLLLTRTPLAWIAPYVDPGIAVVMSVLLFKEPAVMFVRSVRNIILFAPGREVVDEVREIAERETAGYGYRVNFVDVIKTGRRLWIDVYIYQDGDLIDVRDLRAARERISAALVKDYDNIYVQVLPELDEPQDSGAQGGSGGLTGAAAAGNETAPTGGSAAGNATAPTDDTAAGKNAAAPQGGPDAGRHS